MKLVAYVGKQSDNAGTLDGAGQLTLMLCAGAGNAAGKDLGTLRNELSQLSSILVIDFGYFIHAECANFTSGLSVGSVILFSFHS